MSETSAIEVRVGTGRAAVKWRLPVCADANSLADVLAEIARTEWGAELVTATDASVSVRPGYLLVLNGRLIQSWEVEATTIGDGDWLHFAQVVPGG